MLGTHEAVAPSSPSAPRAQGGALERVRANGAWRAEPLMNGAPVRSSAESEPRSFLAFDFGTRRIGTATGNTLTRTAQALRSVTGVGDAAFRQIGALITQWQPSALVVGVPFHPDGAPHDNTLRARRFARRLHGRFHLPVHEVDERYTTTEAQARGARDLDAASAAIILEQFLNSFEKAA